MKANGAQLHEIARLIEEGTIRPVIDKVFPFESTNEALDYVESEGAKGIYKRIAEHLQTTEFLRAKTTTYPNSHLRKKPTKPAVHLQDGSKSNCTKRLPVCRYRCVTAAARAAPSGRWGVSTRRVPRASSPLRAPCNKRPSESSTGLHRPITY